MSTGRREIPDPLVVGRVVGDVLDPFTRSSSLRIVYNNKPVANGAGFKPSAVSSRPFVHVGDSDFRTFYTLIRILQTPVIRPSASTCTGQEIVTYEAPEPSVGIHRLVFVLFRQEGRRMMAAPERRENFKTRAFAEHNGLGQPAFAVYYNCQREAGTGGRRFT